MKVRTEITEVMTLGTLSVSDGNIIYAETEGVTIKCINNCIYYISRNNGQKRILQKHLIPYEKGINLTDALTKQLQTKSLQFNLEGIRSFCKAICPNEYEGIIYSTMKFNNGTLIATVFTGYFYFIEGFYFWCDKEVVNCGYNNIQLKMEKGTINNYTVISKLQDSGIEKFDPKILDTFINIIRKRKYNPLWDINRFPAKDRKHMQVTLGVYKKLLEPIYEN